MTPGEEIGLKIDQTLTQDATGTLVMLEFEAIGIPRVRTDLSEEFAPDPTCQPYRTRSFAKLSSWPSGSVMWK
jgi:hypothetical protein